MTPAALHKIPTHTVDSSQLVAKWILQKLPKIINKMIKNWDKNTINDLEQVCPTHVHDFRSLLFPSKTIFSKFKLVSVI